MAQATRPKVGFAPPYPGDHALVAVATWNNLNYGITTPVAAWQADVDGVLLGESFEVNDGQDSAVVVADLYRRATLVVARAKAGEHANLPFPEWATAHR